MSTFPTGVYVVPTGAMGTYGRGASLCTEYLDPEALFTLFMIKEGETSA